MSIIFRVIHSVILSGWHTRTRQFLDGPGVIIPSFAVGRTQSILYYLHELKSKNEIPDIPVFVDSPIT
jgi:Cft2 family RNA processing exonuclease